MAKIYLLGQKIEKDKNLSLYYELSYRLKEIGHDIFDEETDYGKEQEYSFKKAILSSDIIIPIITQYSLKSNNFLNELIQLRNYTSHKNDKLLIPIVTADVDFDSLPESLLSINFITLKDKLSDTEISLTVKKLMMQ
jgi:hypothetical protein